MLSLPLPLRPEHRLAHFIANIQAIPLSNSHHHLNDLDKCASIEQPWLLSSATFSSSSFVSKHAHKPSESLFASLAVHQQKQLSVFDEESQRLVWLHDFCAAHSLSDCTRSHKSMPLHNSASGAQSNVAQLKTVPPPLPGAARLPFMFKKAAAAPPSCPLLLLRMMLVCRLPDHLLRRLKWLVQTQVELKQQKSAKADLDDSHSIVLVAQIDRILAHCSVMEEACWKLLWQMEQMIKSGVMSSCTCKMGHDGSPLTNETQSFSPWWNHDCMNKVLRIIASHHHLSETSIYAFIDILLGERSLFLLNNLCGTASTPSSSPGPPSLSSTLQKRGKHRTWKTKSFQHPDFVPHFLMGLAHTKGEITHQGLEFMCMMLLRVPENAQLVLRQNDWQRSIAHLLMRGSDESGAIGTSSASSKEIVHRTLMEILNKEESGSEQSRRGSAMFPSGSPSGSPSASPSSSPSASPTATLSPEQLLSTNIKLSINIWVLLHFAQFNSSAAEHDSSSDFEALLYQSFDAIEDEFGWTPATALLVRVLLCSLVTKINSSSQKRIFRNDIHHPSWSALFGLVAVCENFIFYSPISHNQPTASPSPYDCRVESMQTERAFLKAHPESKGVSVLPDPITMTAITPDRRRSISSMIGNDNSVNPSQSPTSMGESFGYPVRSKDNRRFKSVGVHVSQQSSTNMCEDQILVDKTLELLESLKISELELSLDANAQLIDRERVKKLKKMGLYDLEFFQATNAYFKTLVSRSRTNTAMEWEARPTASSISSSGSVSTQHVRSVPQLLEKRRHQRELSSGGGWGGMFQNFTRSRRVLSMEQKLNGSIQDKADFSQPQQKEDSSAPMTRGVRFSDAHRSSIHDGTNTKMNIDLVKMKIESHYLKHRKSVPQPQLKLPDSSPQLPSKVLPPEIPKQRPHPSVFKRDVLNVVPAEAPVIVAPVFNFPTAKVPGSSPQNRRQSPSSSSTNQRRQLSKGVPVTSLVQLMNRPLPGVPPGESSNGIGLSMLDNSDRNVTGPIILSPTNSSRMVEPKEELIDELDERKEDGDLSLNDEEFESSESISLHIPCRSAAAALHCAHCNIDLGDDPTVCYSTNDQLYCRMCFLIQFCCCASCGQLVEASQDFVRVTGVEHLDTSTNGNPELQVLFSSDDNVIEEIGANRRLDDGRGEFIFYHMDCLSCVQCDYDHAHRRSIDGSSHNLTAAPSPTEDDALMRELMESNDGSSKTAKKKWYSKLGRIYCDSHYTNLFGANCAQCRQRISPGDLLHGLNQTWHRDCFACAGGCGRKLTEKTAFIAPAELLSATIASPTQGQKRTASSEAILSNLNSPQSRFQMNRTAYCEACFSSLFEVCYFCETALSDAEKSIMVKYSGGSHPYHAHCYQCIVCTHPNASDEKLYAGVPPSSLDMSTNEKPQLYCLKHYTEVFFPKCPACDQAVVDEEKGGSICVNDVEYHRACLTCHVCTRTLDPQSDQIYTYTLPGSSEKQILLCEQHQGFDASVKCHACSEMITDGVTVEWKSNPYHASCLSCSVCHAQLSADSVLTDSAGKFWCATHQPQIAPIAKTKEFRPPKLLSTKYSTLSSSSPVQFPDSGHVKDLPPVEGAINPPIRAYHTAMPDTFKPQTNPNSIKSPPSGHKFATLKANFHSPPPPIISPKAASAAPSVATALLANNNTAAGAYICAQCSKSLVKGNLVELNSAQKYHSHCLYCSMCRVPFNANKLSAFEVHADTNKLYCTNCIRKVK